MKPFADKLRLRDLFGYGVGQTGNQILRDVPSTLLLFYMTSSRMIPPAYAGFAILLPKIWVVIADPLVGMISDRTTGRWGSRKPFMLAGSLISGLSFLLLFTCPTPHQPLLATAIISAIYLVLCTGFSLFSVPYLALAADLSDVPKERTKALGFKQFFSLVGVMGGLALAPWLLTLFGSGARGYGAVAIVLGGIVVLTTLLTALVAPIHKAAPGTVVTGAKMLARFKDAFTHDPFRIVFITSTLQLFAFGATGASALYFVVYVLHMPISAFSGYIMAAVAGALIAQPIWVALAARHGTLKTYHWALLTHAVTTALMLGAQFGGAPLFYALGFIGGTTTMGSTLMSFAMLVEVIAIDGPDSTRKGLFAAVYTAMEKAMLATGGFFVAILLSLAHFTSGAPIASQPANVSLAILAAYVGVPVAALLLSLVVLSRYDGVAEPAATVPAAS